MVIGKTVRRSGEPCRRYVYYMLVGTAGADGDLTQVVLRLILLFGDIGLISGGDGVYRREASRLAELPHS